jgi:hypothetical protein
MTRQGVCANCSRVFIGPARGPVAKVCAPCRDLRLRARFCRECNVSLPRSKGARESASRGIGGGKGGARIGAGRPRNICADCKRSKQTRRMVAWYYRNTIGADMPPSTVALVARAREIKRDLRTLALDSPCYAGADAERRRGRSTDKGAIGQGPWSAPL